MIKYRLTFEDTIIPVEVAGETEKMVILKNGRKEKKQVADERYWYFDSPEEAHSTWINKRQHAVNSAKNRLKQAEKLLEIALQYEYKEQNNA